jgi:hypothetical protein
VASVGFGTIMQQFKADAYRGKRLRPLPRSSGRRGRSAEAGFGLRIDGRGRHLQVFAWRSTNMQNRGITGTNGLDAVQTWCSKSAERESTLIAFGVAAIGCRTDLDDRRANRARRSGGCHRRVVPRLARDHPINLDFTPARAAGLASRGSTHRTVTFPA